MEAKKPRREPSKVIAHVTYLNEPSLEALQNLARGVYKTWLVLGLPEPESEPEAKKADQPEGAEGA